MVKKSACFFFWIFLVSAALSVSCSAAAFVDDCSPDLSTLTRETYNLANANGYFQSFPRKPVEDTTALAIQDYKEYGEIIYSIQDVQEITVSAYRVSYPSFAVRDGEGALHYGVMPDEVEGGEMLPLWLDESTDYVYCIVDEQYFLLYGNYLEEVPAPENELVPYGIDIQQSLDGRDFESVEIDQAQVTLYSDEYVDIFDESFSASISPESRYIRVRMKQFSLYPIPDSPDGSMEYKANLAMIHEVICEGDGADLNPGGGAQLPEGEPPEEEQQDEKDEKEESGSSKKSSSSSSSKSSGSTSTTTSTTTSTSTSESTSTTTTDSNNTTTTNNYTSNYFFINLPPEMEAALKQALGGEEETADDADLGGASQADLGSTAQTTLTETEEVLYQDELTVGASDSAAAASVQPPQDSDEGEDRKLLYLLILLVSGVAVLEVMRILRTKGTPEDEPDDGSI